MEVYIKGMEMPTTGLYFVSVDNTGGRDKTIMTVERMLCIRDLRQIVGSFELVPVPPHGRLIDADALMKNKEIPKHGRLIDADALLNHLDHCMFPSDMVTTRAISMATNWIKEAPTVIPAEEKP